MTVYNISNISQTVHYKQREEIREIKIRNKTKIINLKIILYKKKKKTIEEILTDKYS